MTAPPVPKDTRELEEMLNDAAVSKEILASRSNLVDFIQKYANQQQPPDGPVQQQMADQMQRIAQEEAQKQLADALRTPDGIAANVKRLNLDPSTRSPNMRTSHRQGTGHNPAALGAKLDGMFDTPTEYFRAIWHQNQTPEAETQRREIKNAFGSTVPADGGFLVPETLRSTLLQIALEQAIVRPRATVLPMDSARVPIPMIDSTSNASSVFGGMVAYWGEEGAALTDASMTFGRVVLDAKKLTGLSVVPNELLTDSLISFSGLVESKWPVALAWFEDRAFITGTGAGEPLGFQGAGAAVVVDKQSGQPAATIAVENINRMYARMLPASLNSAVWLCSPGCLPELFEMALPVGTGGSPVFIANVSGQPAMMIYGRPLIVTEKLPQKGTQGDIVFADLSYYLIGDRQQMTAASSTEWKFGNDQTAFRIIQRVDGRPWVQSAVTPANSGDTLSPFVELQTRS